MKNKFALKDFTLAMETLLRDKTLKSVIVFCEPLKKVTQRVKATKVKGDENQIRISFGKLNYSERNYIAKCKKQKFNVKKLLVSFEKVKK